jgi:hypothetical protein
MLISIVGLQDQFMEWCEALVVKLTTPRSLLVSRAGNSEQLVMEIMTAHPFQNVLLSHSQQGTWSDPLLLATNGRCIVSLSDPRACVAKHAAAPGSDLVVIIRSVANSCATLTHYLSFPGALVVRAEDVLDEPVDTARRIADHLGLPSSDDDILGTLDSISPLRDAAGATVAWENCFDKAELDLVNGALAGYAAHFAGAPLRALRWQPNLFIIGDTHQRLDGPIDISGGSRCLLYGPYIHLPPGRWSAEVTIAFAELDGAKEFTIDVTTSTRLNSNSIKVVDQGAFRIALPFVIDPASESAIEIHVFNHQPLKGRLALGGVTLWPDEGAPVELLKLLEVNSGSSSV